MNDRLASQRLPPSRLADKRPIGCLRHWDLAGENPAWPLSIATDPTMLANNDSWKARRVEKDVSAEGRYRPI